MAGFPPLVGGNVRRTKGVRPFRKAKGARERSDSGGCPPRRETPTHHQPHPKTTTLPVPPPSRSARARAQAQDIRQQSAQGMPVLHPPLLQEGAGGGPPLGGTVTANIPSKFSKPSQFQSRATKQSPSSPHTPVISAPLRHSRAVGNPEGYNQSDLSD